MDYAGAISSIESGGKYDLLGPPTKGDRAYGKFQIMGSNIGPWSKEILGQEVSPEQFLASPQLQDAIFQGKFQQYVDKYGPEGAAKAWFAGERGMNNPNAKDVLGTSVSGYGARFMKALGPQMASGPTQDTPAMTQAATSVPVSSQPMPAYGWSPQNAPAGISEAQAPASPQPMMAQPPQLQLGAPRRPPSVAMLQAFLQQHAPASPGLRFLRG